MTESVVEATIGEGAGRTPTREGTLSLLRVHVRPILVLLVALPLTAYAVVRSTTWFDAPFPGFFLMHNAVVPTVSGYTWPHDRAALFHSQVVAIDGIAVRSNGDVYQHVAQFPTGTSFEYTLQKGGVVFRRTVPSMPFTLRDYLQTDGILLGFGCLSLAVGLIVSFMQPHTTQARVYLLQGFVAGMYPVTAIFLHQAGFRLLTDIYFVFECLFPATFVHLALVFPVERHYTGRHRFWPVLPYLLSAVLTLMVLNGFHRTPPDLSALHATYLYTAASVAFFVATLSFAYWKNAATLVRSRLKAVLPFLVLGTAVAFYAFLNNAFSGGDFPVQFALFFPFLFYAAVAYAIAKHDLFDIDRFVRLSFAYAALSIIVIAAYALVLAVPTWLFPAYAAQNQTLLGTAFILLLAFAFDPLRRGVQTTIDRAFYRTRLDYRATISALSQVLTSLLDLREVVGQVTHVLTDAMHLESATVCLLADENSPSGQWSRGSDGILRGAPPDACVPHLARAFEAFPREFNAVRIAQRIENPHARDEVHRFLTRCGAAVILPLTLQGRATGMLIMGQKRSGLAFDWDDIDLLRTLANQTAIAIQNARSYQAQEELNRDLDEKVRQRTEELSRAYENLKAAEAQLVQSEKMASLGQLVAGAAHELNNPASLVHGGLANLEDYVNRFVEVIQAYEQVANTDASVARSIGDLRSRMRLDFLLQETPELLRICSEGSERVKKIVEDLRIFARADQGERTPTDLVEGMESTIRLLGARLTACGIAVKKDYRDVSHVEAHGGQLNQVWMNLLSNAIDAVEGRPNPEIRVTVKPLDPDARSQLPSGDSGDTADAGPWVEVQVTDNGGGIARDHLAHVFDPFFTTKAIGRGTGLGLSIVYGTVKSHGGFVGVDSAPGHGTTVTVHLPVVSSHRSTPASPAAV